MAEKNVKPQTEFQKKIFELLLKEGITEPIPNKVAIMTHNNRKEASVNYNFMTTKIKIPIQDVSEQEVLDAGFKWWPTWHFIN